MKIYKMLFYLSFICLSVALFIINFFIDIQSPLFETSHTILAFSGIIFLIICIDMIISERDNNETTKTETNSTGKV